MGALKTKSALISRRQKRNFAESVEFPRWLLAAGTMLVGFMLFLSAISSPEGMLRKPGFAECLFLAGVIALGILVACIDSKLWAAEKQRIVDLIDPIRPNRLFRPAPDRNLRKSQQ